MTANGGEKWGEGEGEAEREKTQIKWQDIFYFIYKPDES